MGMKTMSKHLFRLHLATISNILKRPPQNESIQYDHPNHEDTHVSKAGQNKKPIESCDSECVKESEAKYRDLVELSPDGIVSVDLKGTITSINSSYVQLTGFSKEEIVGKHFSKLPTLKLRDIPRYTKIFMSLIRGKVPEPFEAVWYSKSGKELIAEMRCSLIKKGRKIAGIQAYIRDITERKKNELDLREKERRYQALFESSNDGVAILSPEGIHLSVNKRYANILGYKIKELIGKSIKDTVSPKEFRVSKQKLKNLLDGKSVPIFERTLIKKDGSPVFVEINNTVVHDEEGQAQYIQSIVRDISTRKKVEEEIKSSEERLKILYEHAPDAYYLNDFKGTFVDGNIAAEKLTGYSRDELIGKNFLNLELLSKNQIMKAAKILAKNVQGRSSGPDEFILKSKQGKKIPVEIRAVPVKIKNKSMVLGIARDISERKQAEEQIQATLHNLKKAMTGTIQVIASTVEHRDPYTAGHQRRVADLSKAIALEMGLSDDKIDGVYTAGLIHDIGKIAIPAEILSKPSKLTEVEFEIVKEHPKVAFNILKEVEFPWPIAESVLQHHERLDGSGYPSGLKDSELCIEARILAVADVIEAMASHRPYRPSLGIEAALNEITVKKNTLYDSEVVNACVRIFQNKLFEFSDSVQTSTFS